MSTVAPLLTFAAPPVLQQQLQVWRIPPAGRSPAFAAANPLLYSFGAPHQNYILHQFYSRGGLHLGLVTIRMQQYRLLQLHWRAALPVLQYMLKGRAIAQLKDNMVLPLVADTYTLQYVPAGTQQLLAPPGELCFFYLCAEKPLELLQDQHPPVQQVMAHVQAQSPQACLAGRLPLTPALLQKLGQLFELPATNGHTALQVAQLANELLEHYHFQNLGTYTTNYNPVAKASCLIADHIMQPELEILKTIRQKLGMEQDPLNYQWRKCRDCSIRQYLTRLRMEYALCLFCTGKSSLADISDLLHYESKYYFIEQFKRTMGFAPSDAKTHVQLPPA